MERISVSAASSQFDELVARVSREGITIELERNNVVVARVSPAGNRTSVTDLNRIFASLPSLNDDVQAFEDDVEAIRNEVPQESDPWG